MAFGIIFSVFKRKPLIFKMFLSIALLRVPTRVPPGQRTAAQTMRRLVGRGVASVAIHAVVDGLGLPLKLS